MFRVVLLAYFFCVALAGPSFCCCTAGKVGAWLSGVSRGVDAPPRVHACCRGKLASKAASLRTAVGESALRESGEDHDCDCSEHDSEAVRPTQSGDAAKTLSDTGLPFAWPLPSDSRQIQFAYADGRRSRGHPALPSLARLSGQEMLRALQRFLL